MGEVARVFLKLGIIGFGGPAAHIALMHREVVDRRRWLSDREFLDWVGASNLVPGPNSTELAIHLGNRRAGWRGLLTAGLCFIMPAVVIVSVIAWLYERHGTDPAVLDVRYGVLPVIVAIVAHAVFGLGRTALTSAVPVVVAVAATIAFLAGVHELVILVGAGALAVLATRPPGERATRASPGVVLGSVAVVLGAEIKTSLGRLFLVFLEIGSVLYGSGYVLLAFLQTILVEDLGWLTEAELLDAVTVGQITPGPVFTTATFVGWQIDGVAGAAVATIGIFLPAFVFVAALTPIVAWIRRTPVARVFLDGVVAASLGLMAGVLVDLADAALVDALTIALAVAGLAVLVFTRLGSGWLVAAGLLVGVGRILTT